MRILYSFLLSAMFCLSLNAQTVWTGNIDSDWMNPNNWSAGVPTTGMIVTIPGTPIGGNFPVYSGSPVLDFTIQNAGSITFDDFVYNNGTIINFTSGTLVNNNNYFVNAGSVVFDNDGTFTNTGTFENFGIFDNAASANFTNADGASLINHGLFRNNGLLDNNGTITNYGNIRSTNDFQNAGSIINYGNIENPFGSVFTSDSGANVDNKNGSVFAHNGTLNHNGDFTNDGVLEIQNAGDFVNDGLLLNNNDLQVSGRLLNNNTVTNNGYTTINDAGTLDNKSAFNNNGTIETKICGAIIQDSPVDIAATVLHDGIIYEIQGNVDETILEFGEVYNDLNQTKPPVAGCKSGAIVQLDENGQGTLDLDLVDKGSYASCGATVASRTLSQDQFTIDDLGAQSVTLTIEDNLGISSTCDAVIFVVEFVPPIEPIDDEDIDFACPEDITISPQPGEAIVSVSWDEPAAPTTTCTLNGEVCADRTATNTTQCNSGVVYGFYLKLSGFNYHYTLENGSFKEFEDGTAQFTGTLTNVDNSAYQFDIEVDLTGRTFSPPAGSPKESFCDINEDASDWYYYTTSDGTLTGLNELAGAEISISRFGEAFQIGKGANPTDGTNAFAASGWLSAEVLSQPDNGPELEIVYGNNPQAGDINIMLSGDGNECRPEEQCINVDEDIPGFIFMGEYNNSKYYCSNNNNWTWSAAKAEAAAKGGFLAVITSQEENDFIRDGLIADRAWIGYTDEANEGDFEWVNGEDDTYTNWNSGEPNDYGNGEDYTEILKSHGRWNDLSNSAHREFVMEIPCSNEAPTCDDVSENKPGFIYLGEFNDAKYFVSDHPSDWGYAKSNSEANGGHLVVINSQEENDFIQNNINPSTGSVWTGLNTVASPDVFNWVNGDPVNYTNWQAGEPNGNGTNQAVRLKKSSGEWTDRGAYSYSYEYVMEVPCSNTPSNCEDVVLDIVFDNYPEDVSWEIRDENGSVVASGGNYGNQPDGSNISITNCLTDGCYDFIISDSYGDGICCQYGNGSYTLTGTDGTVYGTGGDYGDGETVHFCISGNDDGGTTPDEPVVQQISGPPNGGDFGIGITEIAYEVTDACGNQEICIFTVTVEDNPAEITSNCPADIVINAEPGAESAVASWTEPTATSTCFVPGVEITRVDEGPENGGLFPVGTTFVSYSLVDSCNNFAQCAFNVTVNTQDAVLTLETCPADFATDTDNFNWTEPTASTTCFTGNVTVEQVTGPANGSSPAEGIYEIIYLINDDCGNSEICIFNVEVASTCPAAGTPCDDGDDCTTNDVEDGNCNCSGTYTDSDGDGVCDAEDVCAGGDDNLDTDGDGVPDFCDDCSTEGQPCDDGDACTTGDVFDANCNCAGTFTDSDGDGVCDAEDVCAGGDDNIDTDGDGVPDFCDNCSTVGQPCDDGDACTTGDVYDANCNCSGTFTDSDGDGVCDAEDVCAGGDDNIDTDGDGIPDFCDDPSGDPCDDIQLTIGTGSLTVSNIDAPIFNIYVFNSSWGTEFNCNFNCTDPTTIDLAPGTYYVKVNLRDANWQEICEIFETIEIPEGCPFTEGTPCDDGDACTTGDVYDANCNCSGTFTDSDGDGVCDAEDVCAGFDDTLDDDGDGIPNACDTNECDNVTDAGEIAGDETGCEGYDPAPITSVELPSGGSGTIEYLWLSSTTECPIYLNQAIPGANQATFDPGPISQTTYYVRCSRRSDCDDWSQGESNCIVKTVDFNDSDYDGVCDAEDICAGGDDNVDTDGDGTPDFCDNDDPNGDPCDDVSILTGPGTITVSSIDAPIFNVYVFNSSWGTEFNCNYACDDPTVVENLAAGTYFVKVSLRDANWQEICEIFETIEVSEGCPFDEGSPCDDGDACTTGDVYDANCNCSGTFTDSDGDGVCDAEDVCAGFDDNMDDDGDGIPDACDTNECDNVTDGGEITGDEAGCVGYDPAPITSLIAPSGGNGNIEYLWLSSTTGCPTNLNQAIPGADQATFDPGAITQTTYYVRCSRRTDCDDWTQGESNCIIKTVIMVDTDNDGVCDAEDVCEGGDDNIDVDGDGIPDDCDDNIGNDDPCADITIITSDSSITVTNLNTPIFTIMIFNSQWQTVYNCGFDCTDPAIADGLPSGSYYISVKLYDENWTPICAVMPTVTVGGSSQNFMAGEEILDFRAIKNGRNVNLYWMTNSETRNDYFILERSYDGINFEPLMNVASITDNPGAFNYTEYDLDPFLGDNYYRLKKVHKDGSSEYTSSRKVSFDIDLDETLVFPNPATNEIYISLKQFEGRNATISIFNHLGQRMDVKVIDEVDTMPYRFDLTGKYRAGAYTMYIEMEGTRNFAKKFVIVRL